MDRTGRLDLHRDTYIELQRKFCNMRTMSPVLLRRHSVYLTKVSKPSKITSTKSKGQH
jgi:hypothetical protein